MMKWNIRAELPVQYKIIYSHDILSPGNPEMVDRFGSRADRRLIVIDGNVENRYGDRLRNYLREWDVQHDLLVLEMSEPKKEMDAVLRVATALNEIGTLRSDNPRVAIGGGVLLDVVGLAAGLYRRGIPYIRVPTTLIGIVDVSVAAKTGVNYEGFRNRLGSYNPPPVTLIDRTFLRTLPDRHVRNGLGEIFKMALIKDAALFDLLESKAETLRANKLQTSWESEEVIHRAIQGMVEELEPNLWEKELKRAVDYGHSFSPLIEMTYLPELLHGEAVALDCILSAHLAAQRSLLSAADVARVVAVAERLSLPVSHPGFCDPVLLERALEETVRHRNGRQNLPVMARIGSARFLNDVTSAEISAAAKEMQAILEDA